MNSGSCSRENGLVGTLRSDDGDGDGNENVIKAIVARAFLFFYLG